jgi:UDP-N-acetylmuramoyl-tripeptide--D-alanyl-D-alanine ligase
MLMTLAQAQALVPGSVRVGAADVALQRVHTDTRTLRPGDLYVALRGERFDGHDFLAQAQASGAVAALASHGLGETLPGLLVNDPLLALQQLAAGWRRQHVLPLVAVVGSNGKTTVTQMVAAMLRAWLGGAALATAGNLNNHIGVPLTLLRLRQDAWLWHRAAVLELGMNHPGEIALLARMAAPTVVVVNNAQREHQEFMSSVDAVAQENGSALAALGADGVAVLPAADAYLPLWRQLAGQRRVLSFGLQPGADVVLQVQPPAQAGVHAALPRALQLHTPAGTVATSLHLPGVHNLHNAAAAAAAALAAGVPLAAVAQGLADFRPVAGRSQVLTLRRDGQPLTLIDDSYNANPDSVLAAIDVLAGLPGPRWLVLGDMGEVGSQGPQFHAEVGAHAQARGIETVWAAGVLSTHVGATRHFADTAALLAALPQAPAAASVLVKGSRFMKMEQVVQALCLLLQPGSSQAQGAACC